MIFFLSSSWLIVLLGTLETKDVEEVIHKWDYFTLITLDQPLKDLILILLDKEGAKREEEALESERFIWLGLATVAEIYPML